MPTTIPSSTIQCHAGWWSFKTDVKAISGLVFSSWLNLLLVTAPLGIMSQYLKWGATSTFILNFCALVPLALLLGEVTEDLAVRFGSTIGGLLNATFGNVVELILSVAALNKGLYIVIASSLAGSILSNLLLVLGKFRAVVGTILDQCEKDHMAASPSMQIACLPFALDHIVHAVQTQASCIACQLCLPRFTPN